MGLQMNPCRPIPGTDKEVAQKLDEIDMKIIALQAKLGKLKSEKKNKNEK